MPDKYYRDPVLEGLLAEKAQSVKPDPPARSSEHIPEDLGSFYGKHARRSKRRKAMEDQYRLDYEARLRDHAHRLGIEPEEYQEYEYNTLLGSALHALGFAPPLQGKYEDHSILNPEYWKTNEYDRRGKTWRDTWERKNFLDTWQDPTKPRKNWLYDYGDEYPY